VLVSQGGWIGSEKVGCGVGHFRNGWVENCLGMGDSVVGLFRKSWLWWGFSKERLDVVWFSKERLVLVWVLKGKAGCGVGLIMKGWFWRGFHNERLVVVWVC